MLEILKSMIKEEWRMHSTMFGNFMFMLFPVLIAIFSFAGTLLFPFFKGIISTKQIAILLHYTFVLFGMSVGAFGLFGREIMNRRFGHASLIAYSSRTLPVSEKMIFLNFFVKDLIYYFILWILPIVAGFFLAFPALSISLSYSGLLLLTLSLSFLAGLSFVFLLSTVYAHSSKFFITILVFAAITAVFTAGYFNTGYLELLPPLLFFFTRSPEQLELSLVLAIIPAALSLIFLKIDYPETKRRFKNSLDGLCRTLKFTQYPQFTSKDFLDLKRSEGGLGKIIFSFLFPVGLVWAMLFVALKLMPSVNFLIIFSILLGAISSMVYNWLTEFDLFTSYAFLPVRVSDVIKSKITSYALINSISILILILTAIKIGPLDYFLPALFSFISVSAYTLSMTIYLTGLYPNVLLYNAKIFAEYLFLISPVLLSLIILSMFNPVYLVASLVLIPVSGHVLGRSYKKWNMRENPSF